jgi:asparagine synthase (glutamine-hydrolysing)
MGIPIESREPFLDYRMVELALTLPVTYLIREGWHKWILRKALEDFLPYEVVWRKKKMGFPFPYERFFLDSREIIESVFREANNPLVDLSMRRKLYFDRYQYWRLISFVLWYELFFNVNIPLFERIGRLAEKSTTPADYGFMPEFLKSCQVFAK